MNNHFNTADEAINQLYNDGFEKLNYDPMYPFMTAYNDGEGCKARVIWNDTIKCYTIESVKI